MKFLSLILGVLLAIGSTTAFAAKGNKADKGARKEVRSAIKAADQNGNHRIDPDEVAALDKSLANAGSTSGLKALDKDSDGKMSETEVTALNDRMAKRAKGKGKKKKTQ
jgi:Ca2+-binding EF-hand superfamily protein